MKAAALVLAVLLAGCATTQPARCEAEGGCAWVSRAQLTTMLQQVADQVGIAAYLQGHGDALESCTKGSL